MACIEFHNVRKSFGSKMAIDGLTFDVECGESVALIGPNGAGKSTTLKIIAGLIDPDDGSVSIDGHSPESMEAKRMIGYLPEDASPYMTLSVSENLEYIASIRGVQNVMERVEFLMELLDLTQYRNSKVSMLSRGNRQKLSIALAIVHDPSVMLLDEPLNYLDIPSQERIIKYFNGLHATFLVSTHIMSIAERFTKKVLIINRGKRIWDGTIDELKSMGRETDSSVESVIAKIMGE